MANNMKLRPLLNELDFRTQAAFDKYNDTHKLRNSTKVTIAGKTTTAGQAEKKTKKKKPNSMFGADYKKDRSGKKDKKKDSTRRTRWEREAGAPYAEDDKFWVDQFLPGDKIDGSIRSDDDYNAYRAAKIGVSLNDWFASKDKKEFNYDFSETGDMMVINSENGPVSFRMFSFDGDGSYTFAFLDNDDLEYTFGNNEYFGGWQGYDDPKFVYQSMRYIMAQPETIQLLRGEITTREYKPMYEKITNDLETAWKATKAAKSSKVNEITDDALLDKTIKYKDSMGREKEIKMKTALSKAYQTAKEPGMQNAYRTAKKIWDTAHKAGAKSAPTSAKPNSMFGGDYAKERGIKKESMKLTSLLPEAGDFQARSKETGKLVHFKSKDAYQAALKAGSHENPKANKGGEPKAATKPNDMFGGDYAKDRGDKAPKADPMATVNSLSRRAGMMPKAIAGWADENGVNLSKVSDAINSGELNVFDFMTAVSGLPGNKYSKDISAKYSQSSGSMGGNYSQSVKQDVSVDGQDDEELYNALSDMGYDFGKFGSKNFDEEGFADAAMSLGYRYDDKNKVWNHRDEMDGDSSSTPTKSKYDDKSYWKDKEYGQGSQSADDDYDDDDSWGEGPQLTSDRLGKVESALEDELNLRGNGFETTRESGGGGGGWEGPMTIVSKDADYDSDDYISLSVGSPNNDGKFSIVFANANGEPHFEPNYDALTGDIDLEPQQAYKVTKALMKMPEVQKVLKGEMKMDEFKPIYDKLKSKFSKTESTKLTSMIKR